MTRPLKPQTLTGLAAAMLFTLCQTSRLPAAEVPLPPEAKKFDASITAQGTAPKPQRIVLITWGGNAFWEATVTGYQSARDYLKPLNTTVDIMQLGTVLTPEATVAGLDGALAKQYQGVSVPIVFDGVVSKVNELVDDKTPVISIIADSAERSKRTVAIGTLAYDAGKSAGQVMLKQLKGKGKIAVITGYLAAAQHNDRMNGALDLIKKEAPNVKIVGPFENKDDEATAYAQATDAITANPDLTMIYVTAGGPEGAAKAVQDTGMTGKIGVVAYDDLPSRQHYKDSGEILALVDQSPARQTFDSLVMLHNILAFGTKYPSVATIPSRVGLGKNAAP